MTVRSLFTSLVACGLGAGLLAGAPALAAEGEKPSGCTQWQFEQWGDNCNGWQIIVTNNSPVENVFYRDESWNVYRKSREIGIPAGGQVTVYGQDSLTGPHDVVFVYTTDLLAHGWYRYFKVSSLLGESGVTASAECGVYRWEIPSRVYSPEMQRHEYPGVGCAVDNELTVGHIAPDAPVRVTFSHPGEGDWSFPVPTHRGDDPLPWR